MFSLREEITKTLLRLRSEGGAMPRGGMRADGVRAGAEKPDPRESRTYGVYRILRHLGTGGMGRVYLALDTRLGRHVAIKFLPDELARDSEFLRRFEQEARTASSLNHPNIVTIFDFTEIDGEAILVSEFIEGVTLRHVLDRGDLGVETALAVATQVASALTAAHAAGIVHRDLKPTNIMLRPDGYVKVIDFGLAKFTARRRSERGSEMTKPGAVLGTVDYLSPEQARGEEVDARSDLWSLGVVMYEMLAKRRPFQGETDSHVIVHILDDRPSPLPRTGELAPALASIVDRALEKDRKRRYQSANELLADLKKLQGVSAIPGSGAAALAKLAQPGRNYPPYRRTAAMAIAGIATLLLVFWWWGMHGRERVFGPKWFDFGTSKRVTFEGDVNIASISPDGRYLAYVSSGATSRLRLRNLHNGAESGLPATSREYTGLSFSPDSKTLYYVLREGEIGRVFTAPVIGMADAPSRLLFENTDGPLTFSPSGREFAFVRSTTERGHANNSILVGNEVNARNPETIVSLSGTQIREQLAWSPKDDWIAAITYPSSLKTATRGTVSLFNRRGGKLVHTFAPSRVRSLFAPVALDGGALLLFSGVPESGMERHLVQLYVPTGEFHEPGTVPPGLDSISATADGRTLASVRVDQRSSVWVAGADDLRNANKLTRDAEPIPQVRWLSNDEIVFPSTRNGEMNLSLLKLNKTVLRAGGEEHCVEQFPVAVPGRRVIVYASNCAHGGDDFNIWTLNLATGTRRALTGGSSYDYQPEVSPDGQWIIYTSWSSDVASLWKIPLGGGIPTALSAGQAKLPFFSPDGKRLVAQVREPFGPWRVAILDAADGTVLQRFPRIPAGVLPVRWSPDGQALDYIQTTGRSSGIWRQELAGGPAKELLSVSGDSISDFSWTTDGSRIAYIRSSAQRDVILFYRK